MLGRRAGGATYRIVGMIYKGKKFEIGLVMLFCLDGLDDVDVDLVVYSL
jgi:hypothetical protein